MITTASNHLYNIYFFGQRYDHLPDDAIIRMRIGMTKDGDGSRPTDGKAYIPDGIAHAIIPSPTSDGDVHDWIKDNHQSRFNYILDADGKKAGKGHEVIETSVAEWKFLADRIREFITGKPYLGNCERTARIEQDQAIAKIIPYFNDPLNRKSPFLLNAVPRFGKTFTALNLIRQMQFKNILVLTRRPADTKKAWKDECSNPNVEFIDASQHRTAIIPDPNKLFTVVFASYQDAGDLTKEKFANIININFDLVIVDECHYGSNTKRARNIRANFLYENLLFLSGTPFKQLASGDFNDTNTFTFSYIDEQKARDAEIAADMGKTGEHYQCCPLRMRLIKLSSEFLNHTSQFDQEEGEGFSFNKFTRVEKDKFVHEIAVKDFLKMLRMGDMPYSSQAHACGQYTQGDFKDHTIWFLKGVAECRAMRQRLEADPYYSQYDIIAAYDNNDNQGKDTVQNIIEHIGRVKRGSDKIGTITLSCGKVTHGVSIKEWGSVFIMTDTISPELYFQMMLRNKTAREGKEVAYVFDFNPYRTLELIYSWAKDLGYENSQEAVKEYLRVLNPFILNETGWQEINPEDVYKHFELRTKNRDISKIFKDLEFEIEDLSDDTIATIMSIGKVSTSEAKTVGENEGEKGKNTKITESAVKGDKKTEEINPEIIREQMKKVLAQLPNFISIVRGSSFDEVIENATEKQCQSFLGVSLKQLRILAKKQSQSAKFDNDTKVRTIRSIQKEEANDKSWIMDYELKPFKTKVMSIFDNMDHEQQH